MKWSIKYVKGDLVRDAERDYDVIAHGCNCYCTMGAGIALAVKNKFPLAYAADKASNFADKSKLGTYTKWSGDKITILNMYTQWDYKGSSVKADYEAIKNCMKLLKQEFSGKKIGMPLIGAGLAGGDWSIISSIIEEELIGEDIAVVIWEKTKNEWELDLIDNKKSKIKVYIDLDDTSVNYTKQLRKYQLMYPSYQYPQSVVGFFSTMEPMPGFINSWNILSEYYDLRFLTRPSIFNLNSYTEKAVWVRDNIGGIEALEKLNLCPDKSIVGSSDDILIDDWDIHGQKYFKGEFIHFGKSNFLNWKQVTEYLLKKAGLSRAEIESKIMVI